MEKTLMRFFGYAVMVCATFLGLPTSAHGQAIVITAEPQGGPTHQSLAQVIHVTNARETEITSVIVTFRAPKGAKVDTPCQVDHFPGGFRSYTCLVGTLMPGKTADIIFSISMTKSGDDFIGVQVNGDGVSAGALLSITIG